MFCVYGLWLKSLRVSERDYISELRLAVKAGDRLVERGPSKYKSGAGCFQLRRCVYGVLELLGCAGLLVELHQHLGLQAQGADDNDEGECDAGKEEGHAKHPQRVEPEGKTAHRGQLVEQF